MKHLSFFALVLLVSCTTKTVQLDPYCGDGLKNLDWEECDGTDTGLSSCESLGYYGGLLQCNTDCTFDVLTCAAHGRCGDGVLQEDEECDDTTFPEGQATCVDVGYTGGQLICTSDCLVDDRSCATCGDDVYDPDGDEDCDGEDFGDQTCMDNGFWGGALQCDELCQIQMSGCKDLATVSAGYFFTCVLTDTAEVYCTGANSSSGRLGIGSTEAVTLPTSTLVTDAAFLTIGWENGCLIDSAGEASCWGANNVGQVGDGSDTNRLSPVAVTGGPSTWSDISSGYWFTCGIDEEGAGYCWGATLDGRLGNNEMGSGSYNTPQPVATTNLQGSLTMIRAGKQHACALDLYGQAYCWGNNVGGKCGAGTLVPNYTIPNAVSTTRAFFDLSVGGNHSCAVDGQGAVWCWGDNAVGQLGHEATVGDVSRDPVTVDGVGGLVFTSVACSTTFESTTVYPSHTCALDTTGNIWCWGNGASGQLGSGTTPEYSVTPLEVLRPAGILFMSVTAGRDHTCATDNLGKVWCWGSNEYHQISDSDEIAFAEPVLIPSAR